MNEPQSEYIVMPAGDSSYGSSAELVRARTAVLAGLDPDAPLDDLNSFAEIVGDARVVAIGENAHFVCEFAQARQRLTRFLAERCGFTVFAYEFSFAAGGAVDRWLRGVGEVAELATISPAAVGWGGGDLLEFLRRYNQRAPVAMRFVGVDVPEAGGTLLPVLVPIRDYLTQVDPDVLPRLEIATELAARIAADSAPAAVPAWKELDSAGQDALTASLARLRLRMQALEPLYVARSDQQRFDAALRYLDAAVHCDYMLAATDGLLFARNGLPADTSVRERFMADSARWHLDHSDPAERIVLVAHNNHIQKTPLVFGRDQAPTALPMGHYLHRELGKDYVSVALTHTADHVPEMFLDDTASVGFTIRETPLAAPDMGSVEAAALDAGITTGLINLTTTHEQVHLDRMRSQSGYVYTAVAEAFDAVLTVPTATLVPSLVI